MTTEPRASLVEELTRPIIGIEYRTAQEAFDIMADRIRHNARLEALRTQGAGEGGGWASPSLGRAYREVERLRERLAQPSESGIDESQRRALEAIETADTEIIGVAS